MTTETKANLPVDVNKDKAKNAPNAAGVRKTMKVTVTNKKYDRLPVFEGKKAVPGKDIPELLFNLLKKGTPHGEEKRIADIVCEEVRKHGAEPYEDGVGNIMVYVPNVKNITKIDKNPETMFASHMDTVHNKARLNTLYLSTGPETNKQGFIYAMRNGKPEILGADDKLGVYIMLKMIEQKIKGLYVFHVGEEDGCVGSKFMADEGIGYIEGIKRCIAFDRRGYGDVIDTQFNGKCCSTVFTNALALRINQGIAKIVGGRRIDPKFIYSAASGTVTDSAQYIETIPECTNLSIGYFSQHSSDEYFDLVWLLKYFLPTMLELDWDTLPVDRDPTVVSDWSGGAYYYGEHYSGRSTPATKEWEPIDLYPRSNSEVCALRNCIRGWLTGYEKEKKIDQLIKLIDLVVKQEGLDQYFYDFLFEMYDTLEKMHEYTNVKDMRVDIQSLLGRLENEMGITVDGPKDHVSDPVDTGPTDAELQAIEDQYQMALDKDEDPNDEIPFGLDGSQPFSKEGGMAATKVNEAYYGTGNCLGIYFCAISFTAKYRGQDTPIYSKRNRKLVSDHLKKAPTGTKLFVLINNKMQYFWVITGREKGYEGVSK